MCVVVLYTKNGNGKLVFAGGYLSISSFANEEALDIKSKQQHSRTLMARNMTNMTMSSISTTMMMMMIIMAECTEE